MNDYVKMYKNNIYKTTFEKPVNNNRSFLFKVPTRVQNRSLTNLQS